MSVLYLLRWVWARDGGVPARRAVIRWGVRLFRREWRQQFLVFGLLTVAVAAMVMGAAVTTAAPGQPGQATFGDATAMITLPGSDPRLAADIAAIRQRYGAVDVIENEDLSTGTTQNVQLRAEDPLAGFGSPMLALVSGPPTWRARRARSASRRRWPRWRSGRTSATAGTLALLGAVLGSAAAFAAIIAWAPTSLGGTLAHVPWADVLLILAGLPVVATVAGWLLAGRQPSVISRQPLE